MSCSPDGPGRASVAGSFSVADTSERRPVAEGIHSIKEIGFALAVLTYQENGNRIAGTGGAGFYGAILQVSVRYGFYSRESHGPVTVSPAAWA